MRLITTGGDKVARVKPHLLGCVGAKACDPLEISLPLLSWSAVDGEFQCLRRRRSPAGRAVVDVHGGPVGWMGIEGIDRGSLAAMVLSFHSTDLGGVHVRATGPRNFGLLRSTTGADNTNI